MQNHNRFEEWFNLPEETRRNIFTETGRAINLPAYAAEKDWWVVAALSIIFSMDCSGHLVFKGGTSLSKAWGAIQRFSEDIDLALDREFLNFKTDLDKSEIRRLRKSSFKYLTGSFLQELQDRFYKNGFKDLELKPREVKNHDQDPVIIEVYYEKLTETDLYLKPGLLIEIGSRSMKEPFSARRITSYVDDIYPQIGSSNKEIFVPSVNPERTLLEKIFLIHEEFLKPREKSRVEKLSRHLYDIEILERMEFGGKALSDLDLFRTIVLHRNKFSHISGFVKEDYSPVKIKIVPPSDLLKDWELDYNQMRESMIYGKSLSFEDLSSRLSEIQSRINKLPYNL